VAAIFAMEDYGILQIMTVLYTSLACMIYVGWVKPYKNAVTNYLELFNESCIFFCAHLCLIIEATRGMFEQKYRDNIGWGFIIVFVINIVINQALIIS
jgi:hypothetical protein